jgi:hypothetical protein
MLLAVSGWAQADPPSRVARVGYMTGAVSFSPAGESDWVQASVNRPLTTGDRLWADAGARAEVQIGGAMIRLHAETGVSILNLDDQIAQVQLTQGTLNVRVRRLDANQVLEVDTPNLAFTLRQPGEYRITVDADGNATDIVVRNGQGEAYGEGAAYVVDSRQPYRFTGTGLRDYQYVDAPRPDEFDRWSTERDRRYDNSASARYVSQDVVGYQDLDANGTWRNDAANGNVWYPNRVAAGWAPYRDGHWAWVDPWGWTWVDDAPWGFAVSHYGRWANFNGSWGWVPGPVRTRAYYAPALVAFVGGSNFQLAISGANVGGVAWFPLGPRDVYRPSYAVSRGYFENINRSNTVINTTVINNYYNNSNVTNVVYANRQVPGAVIAVPTTAFVQSQPVSRAAVRVTREMVASAPVAMVPAVAPTERSVRGAAGTGGKPPARAFERSVVARSAPPAAQAGFAAQQPQLAAKPGQPLDDSARKELKPAAAAPARTVNVVAQTQTAPPTMRPPPAVAGAKPGESRGNSDERKAPATAANAAPTAPIPGSAPAQPAPPVAAAAPPGQSGQPGARPASPQVAMPAPAAPPRVATPAPTPSQSERGKGEQRNKPEASPAPSQAAPAQAAPPQVATPAPTTQPPEQRSKPEQRGDRDSNRQAVARPLPPPQVAAQPQVGTPRAAPPARVAVPVPVPAPVTQPTSQRSAPSPASAPPPAAAPVQVAPAPAPRAKPEVVAIKPPQPQPQSAPAAEPRQQASKNKPGDKKKDDDSTRDDEKRKQKD